MVPSEDSSVPPFKNLRHRADKPESCSNHCFKRWSQPYDHARRWQPETSPSATKSRFSSAIVPDQRYAGGTACSATSSAESGQAGVAPSTSSSPTPPSAGTGRASASTGDGRAGGVGRDVLAFPGKIRDLIRGISLANPTWGAPRIHVELIKLGIDLHQDTVSKYMVKPARPPSQIWRTYLTNHAKDIASIDFFTVPTATFRVLYVFLVLGNACSTSTRPRRATG
jgi:hypothetical protein